jgi:hypothetical protein
MRKQNYRQAKRNREETRKTKQQQKLERKLNRAADPATPADAAPPEPEKGMEDVP